MNRISMDQNDVAVLEVDDSGKGLCNSAWPSAPSLDAILFQAVGGELIVANEDGTRDSVSVTLPTVEKRRVLIAPVAGPASVELAQGLSGSLLTVQGNAVGILTKVQSGTGQVMRLDFINGLIAGFFDPGPTTELKLEDVRLAFNRAVTAARSGFETAKGSVAYSSAEFQLTYYDSLIVWPGAVKSQVGMYDDRPLMPNFIQWKYEPFTSAEAGFAFYSAMEQMLRAAVSPSWSVDEFPSSSRAGERHIIVKPASGKGPKLDVIFWKSGTGSRVGVSTSTW